MVLLYKLLNIQIVVYLKHLAHINQKVRPIKPRLVLMLILITRIIIVLFLHRFGQILGRLKMGLADANQDLSLQAEQKRIAAAAHVFKPHQTQE